MRSQEDHLSPHELATLPDSPEALAGGGPDQNQLSQHLQQCEQCHSLALTHWRLQGLRAAKTSFEGPCPAQEVWLEFAAGLRNEQSSSLLAHAVGCSPCADTLKEALQLMQTDQLEDTATMEPLQGLASATPSWQRRVAAKMASSTAPVRPALKGQPPRRLSLLRSVRQRGGWLPISWAAFAAVAITAAGVFLWHTTHPSEERLLALAYNKQRTMVLRIPGADPVPLATGTRGGGDSPIHGLTDTTELTEVKLRAQKHLDETPNSPYWHQILGEVQLLQLDGYGARRNFEIAQTTDERLKNLQADLAAAWFEIGAKSGNTEAYGEALEFYDRQLHNKATDTTPADAALIHYNRALCWEQIGLASKAREELQAALSLEPSAAWRSAIRLEIDRLSRQSATTPTDTYETALDDAIAHLLPQWSDSTEARDKITETATLGLRHQDRWLLDWIHAKHTPITAEADRHLAAAMVDGNAGQAAHSLSEARLAKVAYRGANNHPGLLEAEAVETFALQRLGQAKLCIDSARRVVRDPGNARYARQRAKTLMELGACTARQGDFPTARALFQKASSLSKANSLPSLESLALGGLSEALEYIGLASAAWKADVSLLQQCERTGCSPARKYATLYNMVNSAQQLRQPHVAAEIMRTSEQFARLTGVTITDAYAIEKLAVVEGQIGNFAAAAKAFSQAFEMEQSSIHDDTGRLTLAIWHTDQAEVSLRQADKHGAMDLLNRAGPTLIGSDYLPGRVEYFRQLAATEVALGKDDEALANALAAVRETEQSLSPLRSNAERDQWTRKNADVYSGLALVELQRGNPTGALLAWEQYRAAPYLNKASTAHRDVSQTEAPVLVIARLNDVYHGWLVSPNPLTVLQSVELGDRDHLQHMATTFYHLCADKDSSLSDINLVGAQVYDTFLKPFDHVFAEGDRLNVDLDPSLSIVPLSAIRKPDGSWLGQRTRISILPAWWSLTGGSDAEEIRLTAKDRLVVLNGFSQSQKDSSEIGDIVHDFANHIVIDGVSAEPDDLWREVASADIFHFSGHSDPDSDPQLLIQSSRPERRASLEPDSIQSIPFRSCQIAVLAACNTNSADPDQIERLPDLRTAFLVAGARSVIASNWDVDNSSTRTLMTTFYARLSRGDSPAVALQVAQQAVRSHAGWQHPFYWAPFEVFPK